MFVSIEFVLLLPILLLLAQQQCPNGFRPSTVVSNKCFYVHTEKANCANAKQYCQNISAGNSANLISISSAFENNEVYGNALDHEGLCANQLWIGAVDVSESGNFQWIDGQPFTYTNWDSNKPNTNYYHVSMIQSNGRWKTEQCIDENCFICEVYTTSTTSNPTPTTTTTTTMTDCYDWRLNGSTTNGIYRINPMNGLQPFDVYCDMTTEGGGWTVIQSLEFWNNTWNEYKNGFDNGLLNNVWLGNDRINVLTNIHNVTLRIEIFGDRRLNNTNPNISLYGEYNFSISNEVTNYTLNVSQPIAGNASYYSADGVFEFYWNNGAPFSTVDNDSSGNGIHCAVAGQYGGWWDPEADGCTFLSLNGNYNLTNGVGFRWSNQHLSRYINPLRSEMKIRRI